MENLGNLVLQVLRDRQDLVVAQVQVALQVPAEPQVIQALQVVLVLQ